MANKNRSIKSMKRSNRRAGHVIRIDPVTGQRTDLTDERMRARIKKMHEAKAAKAAAKVNG